MDEPQATTVPEDILFWDKHRFLLLILLSIAIAGVMVWISMAMYASSGAAQLDLSRPGYKDVRSQATTGDNSFQNYTSNGPINQSTIDEFKALYGKQADRAKAADAFGGDPLSPEALGLSAPRE